MSTEILNCLREEPYVLRDDFTLYPGKCSAAQVTLYGDRVVVEKRKATNGENGRVAPHKANTVRLADVIGCECGRGRGTGIYSSTNSRLSLANLTTKKPPNDTATVFLCLHAYPYNKPVDNGGFRRKQDIIFRVNKFDNHEQNLEIAQKWKLAILLILRGLTVANEDGTQPCEWGPETRLAVFKDTASLRRVFRTPLTGLLGTLLNPTEFQ